MGIKTAYQGYQPYSYLEAGKDYEPFSLEEWNWAGEYRLPLDENQEERPAAWPRRVSSSPFMTTWSSFPKNMTEKEIGDYNRSGQQRLGL